MCSSLSLGAEGAAGADEDTQAVFWNFIIAVIVLATLIASAALPVAALRQWPGRWRYFAMFPLAALILQLAVIVTGRLDDPGSHRLWPFELFACVGLLLLMAFGLRIIAQVLELPSTH